MRVLVTGGTGTLGRALVPTLTRAGHEVRVTSRREHEGDEWVRADLATGDGVAEAVTGVDAVVHLASAPYKGKYTAKVDVDGTRRLAEAAHTAGVRHLLYVSIIGVDRIPFGYYRVKLAAEQVVANAEVGWSVLRAAQFHDLLETAFRALTRLPFAVADPRITAQPVATRDVAAHVLAMLERGPSLAVEEFGGPEVLDFEQALRAWMTARGVRRPVLRIRVPGKAGRAFRGGHLTTTAQPTGTVTWAEHLRS
ncbi:SDR family oxidoreductase [Allokutzneria oryzae]|uniref:SDR family oxidoreductase n=1 Tax=Allokutzneria oryzae TaxID=1378989 RepID=A0ABV6A0W8_9PSEU